MFYSKILKSFGFGSANSSFLFIRNTVSSFPCALLMGNILSCYIEKKKKKTPPHTEPPDTIDQYSVLMENLVEAGLLSIEEFNELCVATL